MGSAVWKQRKLKIKNVTPKDKDMPRASVKILLRKDPEFDVLCFDIDTDGFHPARVRLWPQNDCSKRLDVAVTVKQNALR